MAEPMEPPNAAPHIATSDSSTNPSSHKAHDSIHFDPSSAASHAPDHTASDHPTLAEGAASKDSNAYLDRHDHGLESDSDDVDGDLSDEDDTTEVYDEEGEQEVGAADGIAPGSESNQHQHLDEHDPHHRRNSTSTLPPRMPTPPSMVAENRRERDSMVGEGARMLGRGLKSIGAKTKELLEEMDERVYASSSSVSGSSINDTDSDMDSDTLKEAVREGLAGGGRGSPHSPRHHHTRHARARIAGNVASESEEHRGREGHE